MVAFHGSADETIPISDGHYVSCENYPVLYGSQSIFTALTSYNVPAILHIAENEGHEPDQYQDPAFVSDNVNCFLQGLISKLPVKGTYTNLISSCP